MRWRGRPDAPLEMLRTQSGFSPGPSKTSSVDRERLALHRSRTADGRSSAQASPQTHRENKASEAGCVHRHVAMSGLKQRQSLGCEGAQMLGLRSRRTGSRRTGTAPPLPSLPRRTSDKSLSRRMSGRHHPLTPHLATDLRTGWSCPRVASGEPRIVAQMREPLGCAPDGAGSGRFAMRGPESVAGLDHKSEPCAPGGAHPERMKMLLRRWCR
jgi:hypothetical protein